MALKAGYIGVKKSMLGLINSISSAKIIKTIGNGLKLTSAGTLSADIDTDTMEFKGGKLSAKASAADFSTDETETGVKWIDGKMIYKKTHHYDTPISIYNQTGGVNLQMSELDNLVDRPIFGIGMRSVLSGNPDPSVDSIFIRLNNNKLTGYHTSADFIGVDYVTVWYTKKEV